MKQTHQTYRNFNHNDQQYTISQSKYLINTSKTLRGNKLSINNYINLQLLRFRNCSAQLYPERQSKQLSKQLQSKIQENKFYYSGVDSHKNNIISINNQVYSKYKAMKDDIDRREQIYQEISEQRKKNTQGNKIKMKIFQENKKQSKLAQDFQRKNQITKRFQENHIENKKMNNFSRKKQNYIKQHEIYDKQINFLNKTISFHQNQQQKTNQKDNNNLKNSQISTKTRRYNKLFYTTSNLGRHMNQYLNNVVLDDQKEHQNQLNYQDNEDFDNENHRNCRTIEFKHKLQGSKFGKNHNNKTITNGYVRTMKRMKKMKQSVAESKQILKEQEMKATKQFRSKQMFLEMQEENNFDNLKAYQKINKYSMQIFKAEGGWQREIQMNGYKPKTSYRSKQKVKQTLLKKGTGEKNRTSC